MTMKFILGFIDTRGNVVIEPQFIEARDFSEGLAVVRRIYFEKDMPSVTVENKYGFIDMKGNYVIEPQFAGAGDFSEGLAAVATGDKYGYKWGFIDTTGTVVIEPQFDGVRAFSSRF